MLRLLAAVLAVAALVQPPPHAIDPTPRRIVSLAPSVTELLFALGLGDRVAGVTSYCRYPPAALAITKIGGYLTPSYETLASIHPDLAIALPEHVDVLPHVKALGIPVLQVSHDTIDAILDSAIAIGARSGVPRAAAVLRRRWADELEAIARTTGDRPRPRVVLCVGRSGDAQFRSITVAGPGGIYDDLLTRAGAVNAIPPGPVLHPIISAETLLRLDPDVIVEFAPGDRGRERVPEHWQSLKSLRAVRDGRIVVFTDDFLGIPGPRFVEFAGRFARALHPDLRWPK